MRRQKASILVGLLWCLVLLSVVVIGVLHTARLDLMVVKNQGDRIQAHYLALAGIERAKALLFQDAKNRSKNGKSHSGDLYNSPQDFQNVAFGRGHIDVFRRGRRDENGGIIYGVSDEESRLNLNEATPDEFTNIDQMTPDIVAAIQDWHSGGNQATPGGAKADFYLAYQPPYLPRNGPFQTVRELLMVRGVTRELLYGSDAGQNGLVSGSPAPDGTLHFDQGPVLEDAGWSALFTVDSTTQNVSATGESRVNVQSDDQRALTGVKGITPDIARAIIAYRGQNELKTIVDLLDVTAPQRPGQTSDQTGDQTGANPATSNTPGQQSSGPKVINQDLLIDIADNVTVSTDQESPGMININTASVDVLACLPGLDRDIAQRIVNQRQSAGYFANIAQLLKIQGITENILKPIAPLITTRSETFRIICEGRVDSSGARQRIQVIVHIGAHDVDTLSYREDL